MTVGDGFKIASSHDEVPAHDDGGGGQRRYGRAEYAHAETSDQDKVAHEVDCERRDVDHRGLTTPLIKHQHRCDETRYDKQCESTREHGEGARCAVERFT